MASALINSFKFLRISNVPKYTLCKALNNTFLCDKSVTSTYLPVRNTSFFNKLPAEDLWKGVISVSNAGKKRGRGKGVGRKIAKDLNKGQVIGQGKSNILWPGLNAPVLRGNELVKQQKLPEDPERQQKLIKLRDSMGKFRVMRINPIDRGWTGSKMPGRSIGPPDAVGEDTFEGFDSRVLELKTVFIMKGNLGRKRRFSILTVTGNGEGSAGFALAKASEVKAALRKSKNRAGQKLIYIDLCDGHTVFHDFYCAFGKTKIFVSKKPEGYGLVCHRAIATICRVIGIKDLHAKIEGSTNLQHIVKAFFIGLLQQKSHQQIAEEKGLHLVEFRSENRGLPRVVASPSVCRKKEDIQTGEVMDFTQYVLGDKIVLKKKKYPPFFSESAGYKIHLRKKEYRRNQDKVRLEMLVNYGELRSFLTDKYPECRPFKKQDAVKEAEN
ncbi:28S ribosomal protein S5, mitochondrial [Condylostylus longicornis]|uniref:28S ribosomal protein S5, mitochondrial n=1 Tax=Condylostylus longicornis TaxID=2530218 RepID=UPI00244E438D|nr:28S ribosomal protein S5, mitochondrial [Condylostylus longicornis]